MSDRTDEIRARYADPYLCNVTSRTLDDIAYLLAENERLRKVAETAGELSYAVDNAGAAAVVHAVDSVEAALDAWRAGGGA